MTRENKIKSTVNNLDTNSLYYTNLAYPKKTCGIMSLL